ELGGEIEMALAEVAKAQVGVEQSLFGELRPRALRRLRQLLEGCRNRARVGQRSFAQLAVEEGAPSAPLGGRISHGELGPGTDWTWTHRSVERAPDATHRCAPENRTSPAPGRAPPIAASGSHACASSSAPAPAAQPSAARPPRRRVARRQSPAAS